MIDAIKRDREAGTPGPWGLLTDTGINSPHSSGLLFSAWDPRAVDDTKEEGESWLAMRTRTDPARDAMKSETHSNARRIARVPAMEAALLAAVELADLADDMQHFSDIPAEYRKFGRDVFAAITAFRKALEAGQ